jgi:hypothetical protein
LRVSPRASPGWRAGEIRTWRQLAGPEGERRRVDQRLRMRPSHGGAPTNPKLDSRLIRISPHPSGF